MWQPIETAPKDGSHILGLRVDPGGAHFYVITWWDGRWCGGEHLTQPIDDLTHWTPLPSQKDSRSWT